METKAKETFQNRAEYQNKAEENHCSNCDEPLIFGLKDKYHEFSIGCQLYYSFFLSLKNKDMFQNCPMNG